VKEDEMEDEVEDEELEAADGHLEGIHDVK